MKTKPLRWGMLAIILVGVLGLGWMLRHQARSQMCTSSSLESLGITYSTPSTAPAITEAEAIAIAQQAFAAEPASAGASVLVEARYVLFTEAAPPEHPENLAVLTNVPAWVVTFKNVKVPTSGGPRYRAEEQAQIAPPVCENTEWNVVIDAQTGEVLRGFTYR